MTGDLDGAKPEEDLASLAAAWETAAEIKGLRPGSVERALFMGVNIRVKFPEAFIAAYQTVKAGMAIAGASATPLGWPLAA